MKNNIVQKFIYDLQSVNQLDNIKVRLLSEMFNFDAEVYCKKFGSPKGNCFKPYNNKQKTPKTLTLGDCIKKR